MSQGLEEELPDSMLGLRSFLTLPMKPEIRVGIGVFPLPFLLAGVGYSINSVREVIDVRLGLKPLFLLSWLMKDRFECPFFSKLERGLSETFFRLPFA